MVDYLTMKVQDLDYHSVIGSCGIPMKSIIKNMEQMNG